MWVCLLFGEMECVHTLPLNLAQILHYYQEAGKGQLWEPFHLEILAAFWLYAVIRDCSKWAAGFCPGPLGEWSGNNSPVSPRISHGDQCRKAPLTPLLSPTCTLANRLNAHPGLFPPSHFDTLGRAWGCGTQPSGAFPSFPEIGLHPTDFGRGSCGNQVCSSPDSDSFTATTEPRFLC